MTMRSLATSSGGLVTGLIASLMQIQAAIGVENRGEFRQIAPDLYFNFDYEGSNSVVLITAEGVLLVDSRSHPKEAEALLAEVRKLTQAPIRYVVNTQFHGDHYLGNAVFKREGATIVAQRDTDRVMQEKFAHEVERRTQGYVELGFDPAEVTLAAADITFDEGMAIKLGGRTVELIHLGSGQNPGDTLVHFPHARAAHPSAAFVRRSWTNTSYTPSVEKWLAVLERIQAFDVDTYLPGHGDVSSKADVAEMTAFLRAIDAGVREAIAAGSSADEMAERLTFEQYADWRNYDVRERNLRSLHQLYTTGTAAYFSE